MKLTKILLVVVSQSLKVAKTLVTPQQVQKCSGLLAKLFSTCSDKGCDSCDAGEEAGEPACGCEEPACGCEPACGVAAPVTSMKAAPIPAPVVDPSARVSTNRRVIRASAVLRSFSFFSASLLLSFSGVTFINPLGISSRVFLYLAA